MNRSHNMHFREMILLNPHKTSNLHKTKTTTMNISYSRPLSQAYHRMKKALFQPFDISKWFRVGFTAWLAGFTDCQRSGGNGTQHTGSNSDFTEFFNFPETALNWLTNHPLWANLIILGIVLLIIFISLIIWVSARGKFMFLHNVANNKQDISRPWHEYQKEGNSLFLFDFFYGWIAFGVFILFLIYCFLGAKELYFGDFTNVAIFWAIAKMIFFFLLYLLTFGYISLFLKDFVVPIMYKNRIGIMQAWAKFLQLFFQKFLTFLIYGMFIFILGIGVAMGVLFLALITCCIGLLLIAIPYIGAVVLLPVSYTFRAFSLEFLAQFGNEFNVFEEETLPIIEEHEG